MTVPPQPDPPAPAETVIRDYTDGDHGAWRSLWAERTQYHRSIYGDPSIGGDDPGRDSRRHEWLPGADLHGLEFDY